MRILPSLLSDQRSRVATQFRFTSGTLLLGLLASLTGCGTGLDSRPSSASPTNEAPSSGIASLTVTPSSQAFAGMTVGGSSAATIFTISNGGKDSAKLSGVQLPAGFKLVSDNCGAVLQGHGTCTLSLAFTPTTVGVLSGTATIAADAGLLSVSLSGVGRPAPVSLAPSSFSFGDVFVSHVGTYKASLTLSNLSQVSQVVSLPRLAPPFSVSQTSCGTLLQAGDTCEIDVSFKPDSAGLIGGSVTMSLGGTELTCALQGVGVADSLTINSIGAVHALRPSETMAFEAVFDGTPNEAVVWSLSPSSTGSIDSHGVYTAAATQTAKSDQVIARFKSDVSITAQYTIPLTSALPTLTSLSPSTINPGTSTVVHVIGKNLDVSDSVIVGGNAVAATLVSPAQLDVTVLTPAYATGTVSVFVHVDGPDGGDSNVVNLSLAASSVVSYDAAVRFSQQAAYGPAGDQIKEIQSRGFDGWIDWQLSQPRYMYENDLGMDYGIYMANSQQSKFALRQRLSLALREIYSFGYSPACYVSECGHYWESLIERDAFGNEKTLLTDVALSPLMGTWLSNAINFDGYPYNFTANQNFAREFMQLMTIGPDLINADGTLKHGADGLPINSYTEQNVIEMAAALSGWTFPAVDGVSPSFYMVNGLSPMVAAAGAHNIKQKEVLPGLVLAAGQSAPQEMSEVIDALFKHPNMAPFLSKQLIQHLVSSNPSPAYVARIAAVFDADPAGVRGNLAAVVKAILLDPEARRGDDPSSGYASDSHLMEPILFISNLFNIIGGRFTDDRIYLSINPMGQEPLMEPSVFAYFSPTNALSDGTLSPEAQLLNNNAAMAKISFVNNVLKGSLPGVAADLRLSPLWSSTTSADAIDRMNHLMFHGTMAPALANVLTQYASDHAALSVRQLLPDMLVIAASSSGYQVIH